MAARELPLAGTLQVQSALAVAAADFDGDGDLDLAALSRVGDGGRPNRVSLVINQSGGQFSPGGSFEVGTGDAGALVVGDFDSNGDPDLAATNQADGTVSVLLGRRGSRFSAPVGFAAGEQPVGLAVGDFNGDGRQDLVAANQISPAGTVSVLPGSGGGNFGAPVAFETGDASRSVAAGDVDGDGDLDLAVGNVGGDYYAPDSVTLLKNNGDGGFGDPATLSGSYLDPTALQFGDIDGDGDLDLVVLNSQLEVYGFGYGSVGAQTLRNDGTGDFTAIESFNLGTSPEAGGLALDDLDGDGDLDLAAFNSLDGAMALRRNDGSGQFGELARFASGNGNGIVLADIDRDGDSDVVTGGSDTLRLLSNNGQGDLQAAPIFGFNAETFRDVRSGELALGDLDGDGDLDVLFGYPYYSGAISLNRGDGTFVGGPSGPTVYRITSLALGDIDGDGDLDLAAGSSYYENVSLSKNNGNATFADAGVLNTPSTPRAIAPADLDGDGDLDLAVSGDNYSTDFFTAVALNNGNGSFADAATVSGMALNFLQAGDLDGDGDLDLVGVNGTKVISLLNAGDGTFPTSREADAGGESGQFTLLDFDGDGDLDLALPQGDSRSIALLRNRNGRLTLSRRVPLSIEPTAAVAADFDSDGDLDLAAVGGDLAVAIPNLGRGRFGAEERFVGGNGIRQILTGDLDGDADVDLAVDNRFAFGFGVLKNSSDGMRALQSR
ncbi:FG-GAP repeat domain-containing protein [Gloeobacter morelensis]|uniref:VCBS repeat-containing protein n=1 Tax=Gloeobacter morelensis MG652769 TaxID=2781736 RepID=A0ABY3PRZ8_9CYAN|nr:VCBS repeat-containing protein [Gloeobacter morelensis]UFP96508.1 VCBS repeat-containing protein [Gloeobacter morelensis MG652769]